MLVAYTNQLNTDMIQLAICFLDFWEGMDFHKESASLMEICLKVLCQVLDDKRVCLCVI